MNKKMRQRVVEFKRVASTKIDGGFDPYWFMLLESRNYEAWAWAIKKAVDDFKRAGVPPKAVEPVAKKLREHSNAVAKIIKTFSAIRRKHGTA